MVKTLWSHLQKLAKKHEKILKELEKKLDAEQKKNAKTAENLKVKTGQLEETAKVGP